MKYLPLLLVLIAAPTLAQEAPQPPDLPPGEDRIESVVQGRPVPFTGMLLDTDTAIRWTNRLTWWRETFSLRIRQQEEILTAVRSSCSTEQSIVRSSMTREIEQLRADLHDSAVRYETELANTRNPPFYETWGFAFGMGALAMGAIVGIIGGLVVGL